MLKKNIKASKDILVYHGNDVPVDKIDLKKCEDGKDFGKGFYTTTSLKQAQRFAIIKSKRSQLLNKKVSKAKIKGYVSVYRLEDFKGLDCYEFEEANENWIKCICKYRKNMNVKSIDFLDKKDVIIGKIADDNTSSVLNNYIAQGQTKKALKRALEDILPNKLQDQICFRTKKSILKLTFVKEIEVWEEE